VEKYGTGRQATDDNIIQCRNDARIHTHTHTEYVILIVFPQPRWLRQYYIICTLSVLFLYHILPCNPVETMDINMSQKPQFTAVTAKHAYLHFKYGSFIIVKDLHICGNGWIAADSAQA
jgi:hypothetical protein